MRIIAMSDSHGSEVALWKIFKRTVGTADIYIHLGDGEREIEHVKTYYPHLDIRSVAGNCDYASLAPNFDVVFAGNVKIFITHGHLYDVKYGGTETLRSIARDYGCKVALFGHTHCRFQSYEDGIYLMNPGSCACPRDTSVPSYGFVDITESGIVTNIVDLD